ncbi:hypothetical protein RND81_13G120500 [Saponaria officinalis]|uniref:BHLH domain-containing protein n=1 Tax=Saponaria officinalis TaxID=3572 RepID=A0AAW1GWZ7_SAPOF
MPRSNLSAQTNFKYWERKRDEIEINELVFKLQALLPESNRRNLRRVTASEVVKEVISYIKKLSKEVDDLSGRLSEFLASTGNIDPINSDVLTNLLNTIN